MNKKAIGIAILLFMLIVVGMFMFAYLKRMEMQLEPAPSPVPTADEEKPDVMRIDAKHFFRNGVHTVAGEILMPTPCDLLQTNAVVMESKPERAVISFDVINNADVCAQVMTPQRFKVSFSASKEAVIEAVYKGEPVILNLIEAGAGENPEEFELFIKG